MKIIVLGGFLGSGKTTILQELAKHLITSASDTSEYPVVILENEISEAGVDNQLLRRQSFTVENIFSGCICCSSAGALIYAASDIEKKYRPDYLLIEATGVADPSRIKEELRQMGYESSILAIADAGRWQKVRRALGMFVENQLKDAAVILLNKIDKADEASLQTTIGEIREYNEKAMLLPICALHPMEQGFWEKISNRLLTIGEGD